MQTMPIASWVQRVASEARSTGRSVRAISVIGYSSPLRRPGADPHGLYMRCLGAADRVNATGLELCSSSGRCRLTLPPRADNSRAVALYPPQAMTILRYTVAYRVARARAKILRAHN